MTPIQLKHFGLTWILVMPIAIILAVLFPKMILQEVAYHTVTLVFLLGILLTVSGIILEKIRSNATYTASHKEGSD